MKDFLSRFRFNPKLTKYVGIERECFLTDLSGRISPIADSVIRYLGDEQRFGYELSACQLEERCGPHRIEDVPDQLQENAKILEAAERELGFRRLFTEVGPDYMPLDVYPDPAGRYTQLVRRMPREVLLAACRVIGTHIHIGMPDMNTAIRVYNRVVGDYRMLCELGDGSSGRRLESYRIVAPNCDPPMYDDAGHFYRAAVEGGFAEDPRRCWTIIRISVHGTIEFRMFGSTASLSRVSAYAQLCHRLCGEVL